MYKIGQEISVDLEFEIKSGLTGEILIIGEGTRGFVDSEGAVHFTSGEASGKVVKMIDPSKVSGYDTRNISELILERFNEVIGVEEILEDCGISKEKMLYEIQDLLLDIF